MGMMTGFTDMYLTVNIHLGFIKAVENYQQQGTAIMSKMLPTIDGWN